MGSILLGIGGAIAIVLTVLAIFYIAIKFDEQEWWKTALLFLWLGVIALTFVGLGIWLS